MRKYIILFIVNIFCVQAIAQQSILKGRIYNSINNESLPFVTIVLKNASNTYSSTSDTIGNYEITVPNPGVYNLEAIMVGFKKKSYFEIALRPENATIQDIALEEDAQKLGEVTIQAATFYRKDESPVSLRTIGVAEIKRNPGGNRDISKVIQSLPGVASVPSFRNDLIVRGGSPNENRFYLDGIEVPTINHFSTQGASGGPVGMLNVDFIDQVDFYSGAFPANRGNTLSSVLDFKYKSGRSDKPAMSITIGASDLGFTYDGLVTKKSTIIASIRRSYLQFLFAALELPFLPTYNDFQFKYQYKPDLKNEFTFIGLGAFDDLVLNEEANKTEEQQYILRNIPENQQWNYTLGGTYRHFSKNSFVLLVLSRNHLNNEALKYQNNDDSNPDNLILNYNSQEIENKFRIERTSSTDKWKANYGVGMEDVTYTNTTFNKLPYVGTVNYSTDQNFFKYSAFGQISRTFAGIGLVVSAGARVDANTLGSEMDNPLDQFSPRISLSYNLTPKLTLNANAGIYYQLPAYTILGYKDNNGTYVNEAVKYIRCNQVVAGFEYLTNTNSRFTLEGFYKVYTNYPYSLNDSLSIANQGSDFGVVGDGPVDSRSKGRAYGLEFLFQQKFFKNIYGLVAYTLVKSEFTNLTDEYTASSWDYLNIISLTMGKVFKKNWEAGAKFRFNSGSPYTPYNLYASATKTNWDITGQGIPDNSKANTYRTPVFTQLDIRIDKKYFYKKWSLDIYLDIQNLFNQVTDLPPYLDTVKDVNGNPETDPFNSNLYIMKSVENTSGSILPTLGLIFEF